MVPDGSVSADRGAPARGGRGGEGRASLSAALEAALLRELVATHGEVNATYFRRALRPVGFELSAAASRLGRWRPEIRTIEVSRGLVLEQPWGVVVEVLKHEMAHQYVHEVLGASDEAAHGPAFRATCARMGIDPAATGLPASGARAEGESARVLERITKLLALAESANVHEAEAAMGAAPRLMLKYNLDAVRSHAERRYGYRHLGAPTGRVGEHERLVAAILGEHFFVEVIWVPVYRAREGKRGSVLEICGSDENLELATYVHAFLLQSAERLWAEHKRAANIRSNRDRRAYLSGVMTGFLEKLRHQKTESRERGLVWIRDADLSAFYRTRHPHIHHARYAGNRRTEAHSAGRAAGRKLVLHRGVAEGPSGARRLLGR